MNDFIKELTQAIDNHQSNNKTSIINDLSNIIASEPKRNGELGMSTVGDECERKLWYSFHRVRGDIPISERLNRIFMTGHIAESFIINDLKKIGCKIYDQQKQISNIAGHLKGHIDGIVEGLPNDPENQYLLEIKTHNDKNFKQVEKHGVTNSKFVHYSQVQLYMHHISIKKCLYIAYNKNTSDYYFEIIEYAKEFCEDLIKRCSDIIGSEEPPRKKFSPHWYVCKWCDYRNICHSIEPKKINISSNCRTCQFGSIIDDGKWQCDLKQKELTFKEQKKGCEQHIIGWGLQ
jgi:hypothetical protein